MPTKTTLRTAPTLFVTPTEVVLSLRGAEGSEATALRLGLVGANPPPAVMGEKPLSGNVNCLTGNDAADWKTDLPTYARVTCQAVYPGVYLTWYGKFQYLSDIQKDHPWGHR